MKTIVNLNGKLVVPLVYIRGVEWQVSKDYEGEPEEWHIVFRGANGLSFAVYHAESEAEAREVYKQVEQALEEYYAE